MFCLVTPEIEISPYSGKTLVPDEGHSHSGVCSVIEIMRTLQVDKMQNATPKCPQQGIAFSCYKSAR